MLSHLHLFLGGTLFFLSLIIVSLTTATMSIKNMAGCCLSKSMHLLGHRLHEALDPLLVVLGSGCSSMECFPIVAYVH